MNGYGKFIAAIVVFSVLLVASFAFIIHQRHGSHPGTRTVTVHHHDSK